MTASKPTFSGMKPGFERNRYDDSFWSAVVSLMGEEKLPELEAVLRLFGKNAAFESNARTFEYAASAVRFKANGLDFQRRKERKENEAAVGQKRQRVEAGDLTVSLLDEVISGTTILEKSKVE